MKCFKPGNSREVLLQKSMVTSLSEILPIELAVSITNDVLLKNNGNPISRNPDGSPSKFYNELVNSMPRSQAFQLRIKSFSDSFLAKTGNWILSKKEPSLQYVKTSTADTHLNGKRTMLFKNGSIQSLNLNKSELNKKNDDLYKCLGFAEKGITDGIEKGGEWSIEEDFINSPLHSEGGVDIIVDKDGVSFKNGNSFTKAAQGLQTGRSRGNTAPPPGRTTLLALSKLSSLGIAFTDEQLGYRPTVVNDDKVLTKSADGFDNSTDGVRADLVSKLDFIESANAIFKLGGFDNVSFDPSELEAKIKEIDSKTNNTATEVLTTKEVSTGYVDGDPNKGYVLYTSDSGKDFKWTSLYQGQTGVNLNNNKCYAGGAPANYCGRRNNFEVMDQVYKSIGYKFTSRWEAQEVLGIGKNAWDSEFMLTKGGVRMEVSEQRNFQPGDQLIIHNYNHEYCSNPPCYSDSQKSANAAGKNGHSHVGTVDEVTSEGFYVLHQVGSKVDREFIPYSQYEEYSSNSKFKYMGNQDEGINLTVNKKMSIQYVIRPDWSKLKKFM